MPRGDFFGDFLGILDPEGPETPVNGRSGLNPRWWTGCFRHGWGSPKPLHLKTRTCQIDKIHPRTDSLTTIHDS